MRMKLLRLLRVAPLALMFAGVASAQTTGTIIGVVTDAQSGKPVAGALVVATSPNLQGEQTVVTDKAGAFRLQALPPGDYKISAQFDGYKAAERADLTVRLDKTIRANLAIVPEAVTMEEQVVRTGQSSRPVVNIGSAESATIVSSEFVQAVPVGRNFEAVAIVAPTATSDQYGIGFAGGQSAENNYIIDGLSVTDLGTGIAGASLLSNFVQETDLKTGSFTAEFGRSTGGIVNVLTKSGSNEFHGSIFGNFEPGQFSPEGKTLARNAQAIGSRSISDERYYADYGAEVGGPILKDKLWFFLGVARVQSHSVTERFYQVLRENPLAPGQGLTDSSGLTVGVPVGSSKRYNNDSGQYQFTGKLNYQINDLNSVSLAAYGGPSKDKGLAGVNATESASLVEDSNDALTLVGRYTGKYLDRRLIFETSGGVFRQNIDAEPSAYQRNNSSVRWDLAHSLTDFYTADQLGQDVVQACADNSSATFNACPVVRFVTGGRGFMENTTATRFNVKSSLTGLVQAGGNHILKGGVDIERLSYDKEKYYGGGAFVRETASSRFGTVFQDFRSYGTVNPVDPNLPPSINDPVKVNSTSDSFAYFLQDSYSPVDSLTINLGVRWELQSMTTKTLDKAPLDIKDNVAPRVQAIWDFTGQGRGAIKASWGRFYESIPLEMGDRSFGGETQVNALREACVAASPVVGGTPAGCDPIVNGLFNPDVGRFTTYTQTGGSVVPAAPDLKGQFVDHYSLGAEYEVLPDLSFAFTYEGRNLGRVIEDMSVDDGNTYFIANPGESKPFTDTQTGNPVVQNPQRATTLDPLTNSNIEVVFPKAKRRYDGFTFEMRKSFSSSWLTQVSYTYSSLRGNYAGNIRPETGQLNPNINSDFDLASLLTNREGPLPGDVPHQFKLFGARVFKMTSALSLTAGAALTARSGVPISFLGAHPIYGSGEAFILPRGTAGRTPFVTKLDLRGQLEYTIRAPYTVRATVDVFNVLNSQETLSMDQNYTFDSVQAIPGSCRSFNSVDSSNPVATAQANCPDLKYLTTTDGRPATVNKNFGRATSYQAPLSVRFGLAMSF